MRKYLIPIILLLLSALHIDAQTVNERFSGYGVIQGRTGTGPSYTLNIVSFQGSPRFQPNGTWLGTDVQVGDVVWIDCARYVITAKNSAGISSMNVTVQIPALDVTAGVTEPPTGQVCAVMRELPGAIPAFPLSGDNAGSGIPITLMSCIMNHYAGINTGINFLCDTINQIAHGFRIGDAVLDTGATSVPKFIRGNTSAANLLPSHLVVDSLTANTFVIQRGGYAPNRDKFLARGFVRGSIYYLQDNNTLATTPDEQYNWPVFAITTQNTPVYVGTSWSSGASGGGSLVEIVTDTASTKTLALPDLGKTILMDRVSAQTLTVPTNSSVAFSIGAKIDVVQFGSGRVTFSPGVGVTLNSADGANKTRTTFSSVSLIKTATNTWLLIGDISL